MKKGLKKAEPNEAVSQIEFTVNQNKAELSTNAD